MKIKKRRLSAVDPLTQATLRDALACDTEYEPDGPPGWSITDDAAEVTLTWPGIKAPVSVGPDGEFVLESFVARLAYELIPPLGDERPQLVAALIELAEEQGWSFKKAKRYVVLRALKAVMKLGEQPWKGRIGKTRAGNEHVSGVPDEAGLVGYLKWLAQRVPDLARQDLLHDLKPDSVILESEAEFVTGKPFAWPDQSEEESEELSGSEICRDRLASAVKTFTDNELLVFLADAPPSQFGFIESLCEKAGLKLTISHRRILNVDFKNARDIGAATGIPSGSIPVLGERYAKKLSQVTPSACSRKHWQASLRI